MVKLKFSELGLSKEIQKAVADMGFEEATQIQSLCIPPMMAGLDIIGQAQTGTGKTAAFGIPLLERLDMKEKKIQALVMCPTRELAIQVAEEIATLGKQLKGLNVVPVYGGQPIGRQLRALRIGAHIVIGTPGRIMDHMERRSIDFSGVKTLVLDEADEMLNMGFIDDIELILKSVPPERQTALFSATMPRPILEITKRYQKNPKLIKVVHEVLTAPSIEQEYFEIKRGAKLEALTRILDTYDFEAVLVFCNTKRKVDELVEQLRARSYLAESIHGDKVQAQRDRVMSKLRKGEIDILVATDVAARGIDVENLEAVFNFDVPKDEEYYVHRIGRTGRAGRMGKAFTFVYPDEFHALREIQKYAKITIKRGILPTAADAEEMKAVQQIEKIKAMVITGALEKYAGLLDRLMPETSSTDAAAAMLKIMLAEGIQPEKKALQKDSGSMATGKMEKIFLKIGTKDGIKVGDIVGAIAGEAGIEGDLIGKIEMKDIFSFVDIDSSVVEKVISSLNGQRIKGKEVIVDRARENRDSGYRDSGSRGNSSRPDHKRPDNREWKKHGKFEKRD